MIRSIRGLVALMLIPAALAAQSRRINVLLRGYERPVMLDSLATWTEMPESPGRVFGATVKVLDDLKLSRTDHDSARGLLANRSLNARTRLANRPMSWMIGCGSGMTGDYADNWRIHMAWAVYIDSIGPGMSRVGVAILAGANNVEGAYKPPVACGSTGALEADIIKRVTLRLVSN